MTYYRNSRNKLLASAGVIAIMVGASSASAQVVTVTEGQYSVANNQTVNAFNPSDPQATDELTIVASVDGAAVSEKGNVTDSSVTVGNVATPNVYSVIAGANEAALTLNSNINVSAIGTAAAGLEAYSILDGGRDRAQATADSTSMSIASTQNVEQTDATPTNNTAIGVLSGSVTRSTLTVAGNKQTSAGTLNSSTLAINASANGTNDASGIVTSQVVTNSSLTSTTAALAGISATEVTGTDSIDDASITLSNNVQSAQAAGNSGTNTLKSSGNDQLVQTAPGGATATWDAGSTADATNAIASNQLMQTGTTLLAQVTGAAAEGSKGFVVNVGGTATDSTVRNDANTASASASGNDVGNAITLSGNSMQTAVVGEANDVGTAAAIGSNQLFSGSATATSLAGAAGTGLPILTGIGGAVTASSVSTSSNTIEAAASGNTGRNSISVTNNTINTGVATIALGAASATGFGGTDLDGAAANAGLALANAQDSSDGSIVASLTTFAGTTPAPVSGASIGTTIGGNVTDSTVRSNANALTAAATANSVSNSIGASGTNVTTSSALANNQWTGSDVRAIVIPVSLGTPGTPDGDPTPFTVDATPTYTGTVTVPENEVAAFLDANGNAVTGTGPIFTLEAAPTDFTASPLNYQVSAPFVITVTNSNLGDNDWQGQFDATGLGYTAEQKAAVVAALGAGGWNGDLFTYFFTKPGTAPSTEDFVIPFTETKSVTPIVTAIATTPTLSTAEADIVTAANPTWTRTGDAFTFTYTGTEPLVYDGLVPGAPGIPAVPGAPGGAGVTVAIGGNIDGSTVTVDGNEASASVNGNVASNRIAVSATNLDRGTTLDTSEGVGTLGTAPLSVTLAGQATADHALANVQVLADEGTTANTLQTTVAATFAVDAVTGPVPTATVITDSSLSVSGNDQSATTRGNNATNSVQLSATNMDTGSALSSYQTNGYFDPAAPTTPYAAANLGAQSTMIVSAPAAMSTSSLNLDGNSNVAEATTNRAVNSMTVTATNGTSISGGENVAVQSSLTLPTGLTMEATGDFVVANLQTAGNLAGTQPTVEAEATTLIANQEAGLNAGALAGYIATGDLPSVVSGAGLTSSSVSMNGNSTVAQATANQSDNALALNGGSSLAATGGVINTQVNLTGVTSNAMAVVGLGLEADSDLTPTPAKAVVEQSTVSVSGNETNSLALGNRSDNALSVSGLQLTANAPTPVAASATLNTGNVVDAGVSASYGVLNNQQNAGAINAGAMFSYGVVLADSNTATTGNVLNASAVEVSGNVTRATGVGNLANNTLTLTALNQGSATAMMANKQVNTGNISATVNFAFGGMTVGQNPASNVNGSSVNVGGNSASAVAVGNSVTGVFTRN